MCVVLLLCSQVEVDKKNVLMIKCQHLILIITITQKYTSTSENAQTADYFMSVVEDFSYGIHAGTDRQSDRKTYRISIFLVKKIVVSQIR